MIALESFLSVLRRSRLLDSRDLEEHLQAFQSQEPQPSGEAFATYLTDHKVLTTWQSAKLLQGRHKGFFLGKYRLLKLLGKGGMSSVYLAEHLVMRRRCAVKVLPWKFVKDATYLQRFHQEAQAVAALDHPNIVRAYDIDSERDGDAEINFLVMEYVDGRNLYDLVQNQGPLPYRRAANFILQAAQGLAHAHQSGMVHRDVKPGNFLVDRNGVVKLADLGLARMEAKAGNPSLTMQYQDVVLGTADYLAPEQARDSHSVDSRADLYGLGCTFYYLLTGAPPFSSGTIAERLLAHQSKEPEPITKQRPDCPPALSQLVRKMMAKQVEERTQSADEVVAVLTAWLASDDTSTPSENWKPTDGPSQSPSQKTEDPAQLTRIGFDDPTGHDGEPDPLAQFLSGLGETGAAPESTSPSKDSVIELPNLEVPTATTRASQTPQPPTRIQLRTESEKASPRKTNAAKRKSPERSEANPTVVAPPTENPLPATAPRSRWPIVSVAIVLVAILIGLMVWRPWRSAAPVNPQQAAYSHQVSAPKLDEEENPDPLLTRKVTPLRPVTGEELSVGREGHFASLTDALAYVAQAPRGEIHVIRVAADTKFDGPLELTKASHGDFPKGLRILGEGSKPVALSAPAGGPAIAIDSVVGVTIENFQIDGAEHSQCIVLVGSVFGLTLKGVVFDHLQGTGVLGQGLSGTQERPVVIEDCRFDGESDLAIGIDLKPRDLQTIQAVQIRRCRFAGPLQCAVCIHETCWNLQFVQNAMSGVLSGMRFSGSFQDLNQIDISNNTFHGGESGIAFESGPPASARNFTIQRNLFSEIRGHEVLVKRERVDIEPLLATPESATENWTTGQSPPEPGGLDLFSGAHGKQGASVPFLSTDPESSDFLRPANHSVSLSGGDAADTTGYVGAVAP